LKEYACVQVGHHKDIGRTIEEWQKKGWRLNTYEAVGTPTMVNHYLLFERENDKKMPSSEAAAATAAAAAAAT
jgi:hypothetical protein